MSYNPEFVTTNDIPHFQRDKIIVSCGIGPDYQEALHSTRLHCEVNAPEATRLFYRDYPLGCPEHQVMQYAFKVFAMRRAETSGARILLWIDTSFQPIGSMQPLWDHIYEQGWYVPPQGEAKLGTWCSDDFLAKMIDHRDRLMQVPLVYSGLVGLDLHSHAGMSIWREWQRTYEWGAWNGPHRNIPRGQRKSWGLKLEGHCSDDPRCEGHRHDEAALSLVLDRLGLVPPVGLGFLTMENPNGFIGHHVNLVIPK